MSDTPRHHRRRIARAGLASLPLVALLLLAAPRLAAAAVGGAHAPASTTAGVPGLPNALRLVVNIPAYRLEVYEGDRLTATYPVTVGKPTDPTPDGAFALQRVVWNPWWRPPYYRKPKDRDTPPGPHNPMGKVKLYFTKLYYLHGTAKDPEIGEPASRGCVRLRNEDAVALAMLVHRYAAPLSEEKLQSLASTRSWVTHEYPLQRPVPLEIRYDLAEVRDGKLMVYRDIYHQGRETVAQAAQRALTAAGYPADAVDPEALQAALASDGSGALPLDALLHGAPAPPAVLAAGDAPPPQAPAPQQPQRR